MFKRLTVKGSDYEIGFQIGHFFKNNLQKAIGKYEAYLQRDDINKELDRAIANIEKYLPRTLAELKGKAKGAEVNERALILMHYKEILDECDGCTTAIYKKDDGVLFSHNEDEGGCGHDDIALIKYEYPDFYVLAFSEYDRLSGSCFGYNSYGLVFSCNYIHHQHASLTYLSRYIVSRALIESKSIDDCLAKLRKYTIAQPFSFNVLDIKTNEVINVENDIEKMHLTNIKNKFVHSNHFLDQENPYSTSNSVFRLTRAQEKMATLNADCKLDDLTKVLSYEGNNHDESILMHPHKYNYQDYCVTLANFSYDSKTKEMLLVDYFDGDCLKLNEEII